MKRFEDHIHTATTAVSLTEAEKSRMRDTLHSYMAFRQLHQRQTPVRESVFAFLYAPRAVATLVAIAVVGSSAGISYAAESALPGDALYAIKTAINEPVQGALALSPQAKADWAIGVAGERAKEAATLAAEHRLDDSVQESLESSIVEHTRLAIDAIDTAAAGAPDAQARVARYDARLGEYARVIASLDGPQGEKLASALETERAAFSRFDDEDSSEDDYRALALAQLAQTENLARASSRVLSESAAARVASRIASASSSLAEAAELATTDTPTAKARWRKSLSDSERLATYLETSAAIHGRTGLVIDDSSDESGSPSMAMRAAKAAPLSAERDVHSAETEAVPMVATLSAPSPAQFDSSGESTGTRSDGSSHDEEREEDRDHESDSGKRGERRTLELSVPGF